MMSGPWNGGGHDFRTPARAKLFCSLIYEEKLALAPVLDRLVQHWGDLEFLSPRLPFTHTTYYQREMGSPLLRRFATFEETQEQEALPGLKHTSRAVEACFASEDGRRRVNIDPGLLLPDKLVLATTKNSAHRPYLGMGIYADLTLTYYNKSYRPLPWTYPDYSSESLVAIVNALRDRYRLQQKLGLSRRPL
ncbi:MAG: DUF4416 family protein [bacterium]